jgi:hypothetical protein
MQKPTKPQLLARIAHYETALEQLVKEFTEYRNNDDENYLPGVVAAQSVIAVIDSAPSLEPVAKVVVVEETDVAEQE